MGDLELTEVVETPHSSNFSKVGAGAFGVSINSKAASLPLSFDMMAVLLLQNTSAVFGCGGQFVLWETGKKRGEKEGGEDMGREDPDLSSTGPAGMELSSEFPPELLGRSRGRQ